MLSEIEVRSLIVVCYRLIHFNLLVLHVSKMCAKYIVQMVYFKIHNTSHLYIPLGMIRGRAVECSKQDQWRCPGCGPSSARKRITGGAAYMAAMILSSDEG